MKFALASDIHLHFGALVVEKTQDADVLILAGDIYEAAELPPLTDEYHYVRTFFRDVARQFKHVLWVAGNHEHYGTVFPSAHDKIRRWLKQDPLLANIQFLEQESVCIDGVWFHGTTLWTDLNKANPLTARSIASGMNDCGEIRSFSTDIWYQTHRDSFAWLEGALVANKPNVVITHHHPCGISIGNQYIGNPINHGYFTELSEFIFDHQEIKFWCCGHIHDKKYYPIDNTYVVCNPRGYRGYESIANRFELEYYDVL